MIASPYLIMSKLTFRYATLSYLLCTGISAVVLTFTNVRLKHRQKMGDALSQMLRQLEFLISLHVIYKESTFSCWLHAFLSLAPEDHVFFVKPFSLGKRLSGLR